MSHPALPPLSTFEYHVAFCLLIPEILQGWDRNSSSIIGTLLQNFYTPYRGNLTFPVLSSLYPTRTNRGESTIPWSEIVYPFL